MAEAIDLSGDGGVLKEILKVSRETAMAIKFVNFSIIRNGRKVKGQRRHAMDVP